MKHSMRRGSKRSLQAYQSGSGAGGGCSSADGKSPPSSGDENASNGVDLLSGQHDDDKWADSLASPPRPVPAAAKPAFKLRLMSEDPETAAEAAARAAEAQQRAGARADAQAWEQAKHQVLLLLQSKAAAEGAGGDASADAGRVSARLSNGKAAAAIKESIDDGNRGDCGQVCAGRRQGQQNRDGSIYVTGVCKARAQGVLGTMPTADAEEALLTTLGAEVDMCLELPALQDAVVAAHSAHRAGTTTIAGGGGQIRVVGRAVSALREVERFDAAAQRGEVPAQVLQLAAANKAAAERQRTRAELWEEVGGAATLMAAAMEEEEEEEPAGMEEEEGDEEPLADPDQLAAAAAAVEAEEAEGSEAAAEVGAASHPRAPTRTRFALALLGRLWRDAGLIGPAAEVRERFGTTPFWLLRHVGMRLAIQRRRLAAEAVAGLDCSYLLRLGMQDVLIGYNDKLDIATGIHPAGSL